jgi:hypothetical protein
MPTTSNFGWTTPADTDLVKDGAAAIRTLGNGIDTSFIDLKGGTTGQVLSKASNTDLDFSWIAADPLTILDAKGDLISATAADTPARLAVGTNGQVLTADSTTSTGLKWAAPSSPSYTWTNFTPSIANFTIGNGTVNARYVQIDKIVIGYVVATLGSTSSVSGNMYFSIPVARASSAEMTPVVALSDTSGGVVSQIGFISSTLCGYRVMKSDGTYTTGVQTTNTIPATWTTGNIFGWQFTYEAA